MGRHRKELLRCLDWLETNIDGQQEEQLHSEWLDFCYGRTGGDSGRNEIFSPKRSRPLVMADALPDILINDAFDDPELMALREFSGCIHNLSSANGAIMNIRANYGTSILMSLFGIKMFFMEDEHDTLPTSWPFKNWEDSVRQCLDRGVPPLDQNLGKKVFETGEFYLELLKDFPKVQKYVHVYHPDTQGPLDICEVLIGSELFYALYDESELIKDFLSLITETYIRFLTKRFALFPYNGDFSAHWGYLHRGSVMLRDDSAMNLSPEMFDEFVRPYDVRILEALGGGAVHFCGRGDHYIRKMTESYPNLYAVNMSQPHLNDVEIILQNTLDRGINLLAFERSAAMEQLQKGRSCKGRLHSV